MEPLIAGNYYHIYNHSNGFENIFREEANYRFFLKKFDRYIHPIADILAYCLMPNHFHFLLKMKELDKISDATIKISDVSKTSDISTNISETSDISAVSINYSHQFKNLFQSYTKAVNKVYSRKGSLFNQRFKRKKIDSDDFLRSVLVYIHLNPVLHGFCASPDEWNFSSYLAYLRPDCKTKVDTEGGITHFGDRENLLYCHQRTLQKKNLNPRYSMFSKHRMFSD